MGDKFKMLSKKLIVAYHLPARTETSHEELQAEDTSVCPGARTSHISVQVTKVTIKTLYYPTDAQIYNS